MRVMLQLLFAAYMSSIERQFEFVNKKWVNDKTFPPGIPPIGEDLVLGQTSDSNKLSANGIIVCICNHCRWPQLMALAGRRASRSRSRQVSRRRVLLCAVRPLEHSCEVLLISASRSIRCLKTGFKESRAVASANDDDEGAEAERPERQQGPQQSARQEL